MSVKLAVAKLSATAAGVALLGGGAVHVAEAPLTDNPAYGSERPVKGKTVATAQPAPVRYVKTRSRQVPKPVQRTRRVVNRVVECEPVDGSVASSTSTSTSIAGSTGRIVETIENAAECAPVYRARMVPVPLPALPPIQGGGGSSGGGVTVIGGGGGFGGGFGGCLLYTSDAADE